jgi:hypothetical protein
VEKQTNKQQGGNHLEVSINNSNNNTTSVAATAAAVVSVPKAFVKPPVHGIKNLELLRKQPSYPE